MTTIAAEYQRFLSYLTQQRVADNTRRLASLVSLHLEALAHVGAVRRARSTRLAPLAIRDLLNTPVELPPAPPLPPAAADVHRLHEMKVGPFRGFMREEVFDLSQNITLVYGANGTGKSSLCEALELAMLGSISEAQAKRFNTRAYSNNVRLGRHEIPTLTALGNDGHVRPMQVNEEAYRFCFIEKNRLDDFGRIAARTPADQRQLIATLFGLEQFSEFVRGFNPSLDDDLNLTGHHAAELSRRRVTLAVAEQVVREFPGVQAQCEQTEAVWAQQVAAGATFQEVCDWLLGTPAQPGRLPYVQGILAAAPPVIHHTTRAGLEQLRQQAYDHHARWTAAQTALTARAGEVSYSQLYHAVLALANGATACPACGTALDQVAVNPFERASAGLAELAELDGLQREESAQRTALNDSIRTLLAGMKSAVQAAAIVCPDLLQQANLPVLHENWQAPWFEEWTANENRGWQALLNMIARIEAADVESAAIHLRRQETVQERDRLEGYQLEIVRLRAVRAMAGQRFEQARAAIEQWEANNRQLLEAVAVEGAITAHHRIIKEAYDEFYATIRRYADALPATLLAGLGESARDLYNAFNRDDPPGDLLAELHLPVAENGRIELVFRGDPQRRYDALLMLSEGHIKCLGLAILLAKNLAQACPVVIFDDVVNAIDDDHRNGIWRTFFEDGLLDQKQIILTSHAEEFLQRIQQELGADRVRQVRNYKFLPPTHEHEIRVDAHPPAKNYVLLASASEEADEKRDALRHARPAIESLTDRLWTWMGRRGDGRLALKISGPRANWELNNKCSELRSALRRWVNAPLAAPLPQNVDGVRPALLAALAALDALLGVNGQSIEWQYLNGGTHDAERPHEFERATVRQIVHAVVALDAAISQLQRGR
ncbi:AAA family ATPase [Cupriavidus pauculus]|uniref:AAA family ATPase n=1 Tax=Cupriavidus TaxID=106589 RepID=UPI00203D878F|nr:AAA family ATPase [Cupriavidus pauculus]MCM3608811.1 AAA family ATPase [Cupriavidus pauculus]